VAAFQDHLIAPVQSCNLIEQDYPALQEICTAIVLNEQLLEKLSGGPRAEADVSRRREIYLAARAVAGGAFPGKKWEAAVVAPEQIALAGREGLAGILHGFMRGFPLGVFNRLHQTIERVKYYDDYIVIINIM
jgi:hypothetical protein